MFLITVNEVLIPILVLSIIGFVFGVLIAVLSKVFYVEVDNRVEQVTEMLPGYNCGACGKAGCSAMANAIVNEGESVSNCKPIKQDQAQLIRDFLAKQEASVNS